MFCCIYYYMKSNFTLKTDNSAKVKLFVEQSLQEFVEEETSRVEKDYKDNVPVISGTLKKSIESETNQLNGVIGTDLNHAKFVELGTRKQRPKNTLMKAGQKLSDRFIMNIRKKLKGKLG